MMPFPIWHKIPSWPMHCVLLDEIYSPKLAFTVTLTVISTSPPEPVYMHRLQKPVIFQLPMDIVYVLIMLPSQSGIRLPKFYKIYLSYSSKEIFTYFNISDKNNQMTILKKSNQTSDSEEIYFLCLLPVKSNCRYVNIFQLIMIRF